MSERNQNIGRQTRTLLLLGFGGLLILLAFTGLNALSTVGNIQTRSDTIRQDYLKRDRVLEQLRSDLYLSGTYVRDLLLDPNQAGADVHRRELYETQHRVESMLGEYRGMLPSEDTQGFSRFGSEVESYFDSLEPALRWTPQERSRYGYAFMQTRLLPRRLVVIGLTDQIAQLNARQLDAGNRQVADLFARFRLWLIALLVGTLVLGLLLAGGSIYRVLRLERLSEQRLQDAVDAQLASRELSARLLSVQESERRAISRELHDEVGQQVSALLLAIGNVVATLSAATVDEAKQQLQEIRRVAERTVAVVRDMSLLLRPSMLDDLGLIPALEWQAREVSRTHGLRVSIQASDISEQLADEQKTCIYRVVQEALRNVTRHAKAKSAEVILEQIGGSLELRIHDDGHGFLPERQKGLGLLGIEERVLLLRGSVRVDSRPGTGTTLIVGMPILRDEAALSPA